MNSAALRFVPVERLAAEGEDVQITRGDGATFRLTPVLDVASEAEKQEAGGARRALREDVARMQERIGRLPIVGRGADEALVGYDDQGLPG